MVKRLIILTNFLVIIVDLAAMENKHSFASMSHSASYCGAEQTFVAEKLIEFKQSLSSSPHTWLVETPWYKALPARHQQLFSALFLANNNPTAALAYLLARNSDDETLKRKLVLCGAQQEIAAATAQYLNHALPLNHILTFTGSRTRKKIHIVKALLDLTIVQPHRYDFLLLESLLNNAISSADLPLINFLINQPPFNDINNFIFSENKKTILIKALTTYISDITFRKSGVPRSFNTIKLILAHRDNHGNLDVDIRTSFGSDSPLKLAENLAGTGHPEILNLFNKFEKDKIYERRQGALLVRSSWRGDNYNRGQL